ncbi:U-box domain-containing protein 26 [Apostasia shenzhenica]|uniref:U-box domain-containing protein 26 n=1 Tax=Apostasia shenzhenica TaxID=1088818 RepID=A0A2H9ZZP4_9ASPA|nr:U-box domain-containing protein 26 [Apostasia shenzhenica]
MSAPRSSLFQPYSLLQIPAGRKTFTSAFSQTASDEIAAYLFFLLSLFLRRLAGSRQPAAMSRSHPKLKPPPRPLFSCGIFRNCTQSVLSPTTPPSSAATFLQQPSPPAPPQPPSLAAASAPPHPGAAPSSSSSSSSSSASHSFTQWRFPLHHHRHQQPAEPEPNPIPSADSTAAAPVDLAESFHAAELHFAAGEPIPALRLLDRCLVAADPQPPPPAVMSGVVAALRQAGTARVAAKVLLAMVLTEGNRRAAVEAGAVAAAVEAVATAGGAATVKERALAALELLCTVEEGAAEVRGHALATAAMAEAVEGMAGRGRECGIGVLAAIYGGERAAEAPSEVARAVVLALQGDCSARGRRKGVQLLRAMKETGRLDLAVVDGC